MPTVICPTCSATLNLTDAMIGSEVRCGSCQEVFLTEAPTAPKKRRAAREDDEDDRLRRRSRRDDDDDDYDDRPRRRSRREEVPEPPRPKRKKKKQKVGKPGLAVAAAILFLIWGGLGVLITLYGVYGIIMLLDYGAPFQAVVIQLIGTVIWGAVSGFLVSSGLRILNGEAEQLLVMGIVSLVICGITHLLLLVVSLVGLSSPFGGRGAMAGAMLMAFLILLILQSGMIVGGVFCLIANKTYEKWWKQS